MRQETKSYRKFSILITISAIAVLLFALFIPLSPGGNNGAYIFSGILFGLGISTSIRVFRLTSERKAEQTNSVSVKV